MKISRIVIQNFRSFRSLDVSLEGDVVCIIGENNTGKTALFRAIQICLDVNLPSIFRSLIREDIHASLEISQPNQVLIGIELTGFEGIVNEEALVCQWKLEADRARIFYRFRPRPSVREKLSLGGINAGDLTLEDYTWELRGGGDAATDLTAITWDMDHIGETVRFGDLSSYLVVNLQALRDVEADLRQPRQSPLIRLIEAFDVPDAEQQALVAILTDANAQIEASNTIAEIASAIDQSFKTVSGPAFEMGARLGLSAATFQAIIRNLKILLSDHVLQSFEPSRNGLGMNNILYIAILIEYLKRRIAKAATAGQLILIEEPEAHLHPQLQASLLIALEQTNVQVILSSHSTQVTAQAPFSSFVSLTRRADASIAASTLSNTPTVDDDDIADLERYLDATKSNLLFARKVMLVEGPAELFLIPALAEAVLEINLERQGISVTAIYGVHFEVYAKLFRAGGLEKKCAIVADADLKPSDADDDAGILDGHALSALNGDFVQVFLGDTTFERELVCLGTMNMFIETCRTLGAPQITADLEAARDELDDPFIEDEREAELLETSRAKVLNTAKRFGKARFAQVAARFANECTELPDYITKAIDWLRA
ncbi:MAG: AAA family ATPase [Pseudomonadota bacterium]